MSSQNYFFQALQVFPLIMLFISRCLQDMLLEVSTVGDCQSKSGREDACLNVMLVNMKHKIQNIIHRRMRGPAVIWAMDQTQHYMFAYGLILKLQS